MKEMPEAPSRPFPWLIAHRGAMAEAPENVAPAFDRAFESGVDGIEFDVQLTADNVPVVFHDQGLERITGKKGRVADYTLAELETMDFGRWFSEAFAGEKIPTLRSVVERYAKRGILMIELKSGPVSDEIPGYADRLCRRVAGDVRGYAGRDRFCEIFILSFDAHLLEKAAGMAPELGYVRNLEGRPEPASDHRLWGYCIALGKLSRSFARRCHAAGKSVAVYSCNRPADVDDALEKGADVVMTDAPSRMVPYWRRVSGMPANR